MCFLLLAPRLCIVAAPADTPIFLASRSGLLARAVKSILAVYGRVDSHGWGPRGVGECAVEADRICGKCFVLQCFPGHGAIRLSKINVMHCAIRLQLAIEGPIAVFVLHGNYIPMIHD